MLDSICTVLFQKFGISLYYPTQQKIADDCSKNVAVRVLHFALTPGLFQISNLSSYYTKNSST